MRLERLLAPGHSTGHCWGMAKQIRCVAGLHRWENKWDRERSMAIKECQLCGKRITKAILPPSTGSGKDAPLGW